MKLDSETKQQIAKLFSLGDNPTDEQILEIASNLADFAFNVISSSIMTNHQV